MIRLLVNDALTQIPGTRTFWHDLMEWTEAEFLGGPYETLAAAVDAKVDGAAQEPSLVIRNATYFGPLSVSNRVPTISLLQDISTEGEIRRPQEAVIKSSRVTVFNSEFTYSVYATKGITSRVIPLPVDFRVFEPGNAMGLQQALSLPDGCVCWIGASGGAAGHIKGWDIFVQVVRLNPDIPFVAVLKDAPPEYTPPNLRCYVRLTHEELVRVIGACRVGLCTSRSESQHLAGIEMGACGLPMVAPPVGVYWKRNDFPGVLVNESRPDMFASAIRSILRQPAAGDPSTVRESWKLEFDKPVIRAQWERLILQVETPEVLAV